MLGEDYHRLSSSPDFIKEKNWYNWLLTTQDLAKYIHPSHLHEDNMKLVEGGYGTMGSSSQYCLRWNNHRNNLLAAFDQLLHHEAFTDVTLACEDGRTLHAHRLVLAACSSYFQALFVNAHTSNHPIVVLKDVRACAMRALLEYMYRGEVNVEHDALQELLKVAESLKVKGLVEELGNDAPLRRPPSPPEISRPPPPPAVDSRSHPELIRPKQEPPTSVAPPPSASSHEPPRSTSPQPLYPTIQPPVLPPHREHSQHRPDHRPEHREHRDHRDMSRELDPRDSRDMRDIREHLRDHSRDLREGHEPRDSHTPGNLDSETRQPLSLVPPVPHMPPPCPDSPPLKRKRPIMPEPILSPTPILRTALGHTHGFPGPDMSSLVSLASSMMPLPGLLSSHVPHLLPHEHRDHLENPYSISTKKELLDEEPRSFSDISRDDDHDKIKRESLANGPLLPDFSPYHIDPNGSSHYSNFVSYVPTPKPEWKRYKQYTKTDLMDAIEAVRTGMTALQASRKYKVPSRTLYDKIKKMGISTVPRRLPSKKPSPSSTDLDGTSTDAPPVSHETIDITSRDRDSNSDHENRLKVINSDEDDHSTSGVPPMGDDEDDPPSAASTPALASFSLIGRQMYENGSGGEPSSTPLDLTDTESILPKRPEIEERA
ncbi:uncharacterized protein [Macrobrachium rosenbergii]|uniref:uncharacterized protein isoform X1 n=2 Tax=Macrobrachium rosenbergii TaxID=79674 RepID=UPI0034D682C1